MFCISDNEKGYHLSPNIFRYKSPHLDQKIFGFTLVELMVTLVATMIILIMLYGVIRQNVMFRSKTEMEIDLSVQARILFDDMRRYFEKAVYPVITPNLKLTGIRPNSLCYGNDKDDLAPPVAKYRAVTTDGPEFRSIADEFFFVSTETDPNLVAHDSSHFEVGYWLDASNTLMRHYRWNTTYNFVPYVPTPDSGVNAFVQSISPDVVDLQFRFWSGNRLDDDLDGRFDEESGVETDDDGDGSVGEDLDGEWLLVWDPNVIGCQRLPNFVEVTIRVRDPIDNNYQKSFTRAFIMEQ